MDSNLFTPPQSDISKELKRITLGKVCSVLSLMMLFCILGLSKTLYELYELFQGVVLSGIGDPKLMAGSISKALVYMVASLFIAVPGFFFALIAIYLSSYRSRLIFKIWIFSSVALILCIPFGTVFGLVLFLKRVSFKLVT